MSQNYLRVQAENYLMVAIVAALEHPYSTEVRCQQCVAGATKILQEMCVRMLRSYMLQILRCHSNL